MKRNTAMDLLKEAKKASKQAYAPYSKYRVGAALLSDDGIIFRGCNIENSSYGLTICAERVAIVTALAAGHHMQFKALAIVSNGRKAPSPCGACRQVLAEFCKPGFLIYYASAGNLRGFKQHTLSQLLPEPFTAHRQQE